VESTSAVVSRVGGEKGGGMKKCYCRIKVGSGAQSQSTESNREGGGGEIFFLWNEVDSWVQP
jgi:hypothetical protein